MNKSAFTRRDGNAMIVTLVLVLTMTALVTAQFTVVQKNSQQSVFYGTHQGLRSYADSGVRLALHDLRFGVTANGGDIGTQNWTAADDVGRDGLAGTLDDGEGDGIPTPGESNLSPASIGPAALGIQLLVHVEDTTWPGTKHIVATAYNDDAEAVVEAYAKSMANTIPKESAVYIPPNVILDFNGNSFTIDGTDTNPDGTPGPDPATYGIATAPGTPAGSNAASVVAQIPAMRQNQIMGLGGTPSVGETASAIDIDGTFNALAATTTSSPGAGTFTSVTWGTPAAPEVVYIGGNATLSGQGSGAGVLLVDGNLDITGQFDWQGLVIVRGDVRVTGGGTGTHIFGSLWVTSYVSLVDPNLGVSGQADIVYSSAAIDNANAFVSSQGTPYTVVYWTQLR